MICILFSKILPIYYHYCVQHSSISQYFRSSHLITNTHACVCTRARVILLMFMIHLALNIYLYLYDMHIILVTRSPIFHTYITPCVYNINPFHNSLVYTASASPSLHTYSIQPGINITQFRLCNIEYPSRIHEISN